MAHLILRLPPDIVVEIKTNAALRNAVYARFIVNLDFLITRVKFHFDQSVAFKAPPEICVNNLGIFGATSLVSPPTLANTS